MAAEPSQLSAFFFGEALDSSDAPRRRGLRKTGLEFGHFGLAATFLV